MQAPRIGDFYVTSWDGDQLEPESRQIAIMEPPPRVRGRGYVVGEEQTPPPGQVHTGYDAGLTEQHAEDLAQAYRDAKSAAVPVEVVNSVGRTIPEVMIIDVRCLVSFNPATGYWRVDAFWVLDVVVADG